MIEIQIHPWDIRKSVTYLFLRKKHLAMVGGALLGVALFFLAVFFMAPSAFTSHIRHRAVSRARETYARNITKINDLSKRSEQILASIEEQRLLLEKFYTIYGIPLTSSGQGGMEKPLPITSTGSTTRIDTLQNELDQKISVTSKLLEELTTYETENKTITDTTPTICPIPRETFVLTSPFGRRINPFTGKRDFHQGIDFAASKGTEVVATASGRVTFAGRYPLRRSAAWWRYGNLVAIQNGKDFITLYAHLSKIVVRKGQRVRRGDKIAEVGNTGWSTSPHLHYEVRSLLLDGKSFKPVDPRIYILDHHWSNMDRILIAARSKGSSNYEPIPHVFRR